MIYSVGWFLHLGTRVHVILVGTFSCVALLVYYIVIIKLNYMIYKQFKKKSNSDIITNILLISCKKY